MPLINGQKMACEPCIRGHRSTKCTHASERLMVPVRKPGRPLSTCPHPPSRGGCGCGGVTAAIPRKQKCNCGPTSNTDTDIVKVESPASEAMPTSPIRTPTASSASYRVQKPNGKANSRKHSFGPATLDRIDNSQFNILPAFDTPQTIPHQLNGGIDAMGMPTPRPSMEFGQMPLMGPDGVLQSPMVFPMYQSPIAPVLMTPNVHKPPPISTMAAPKLSAAAASSNATNGGGGSCCSGGAKSAKTTPPASTESSPKVAPKPKAGGCCASKNKNPPQAEPVGVNGASMPPVNGVGMAPFQPPVALGSQVFQQYYPQPTLFHYPASYGSYMTPLQPAQWRQTMDALQYRNPGPPTSTYDMPASIAYSQAAAPINGMGTSHECTCGDGCQCVGCAAHPYNDATQDYVRSAWESMVEDAYSHSNGVNGLHGANGTNGHIDGMNGSSDLPPSRDGEASGSPTAPQTPSDATSGVGEELSANDFFFVNYPFGGDSCSGETAFCQCGDDCQCLGCSIHNNNSAPVPEP